MKDGFKVQGTRCKGKKERKNKTLILGPVSYLGARG